MLHGPFRAVVTVPRLISWHVLSPCKERTDYSTMRYATLMNFCLVCVVPLSMFASWTKIPRMEVVSLCIRHSPYH